MINIVKKIVFNVCWRFSKSTLKKNPKKLLIKNINVDDKKKSLETW